MEKFHEIQTTASAKYAGMVQVMNLGATPVQIDSVGNYLGSREICFIDLNSLVEIGVEAKTLEIFDFEISSEKIEQETKQQKRAKRAEIIIDSAINTDELAAEENSVEDNSEVAIETTES
jgi:hypothetical protein